MTFHQCVDDLCFCFCGGIIYVCCCVVVKVRLKRWWNSPSPFPPVISSATVLSPPQTSSIPFLSIPHETVSRSIALQSDVSSPNRMMCCKRPLELGQSSYLFTNRLSGAASLEEMPVCIFNVVDCVPCNFAISSIKRNSPASNRST